ncbi:hypothetical protein [Haloferax sp. DFSO52]|uniref:hypothetical protein n=1 Tax=Haloferax sp. DFSO52 TaxID=3388505 RepID=UPI003A85A06E
MNSFELLSALLVVATGVYLYRQPMETRSFVSPKTWNESPQDAERTQREKARFWGLVFVAIGLVWAFIVLAF